jgi:serine/threonine-protein kinase
MRCYKVCDFGVSRALGVEELGVGLAVGDNPRDRSITGNIGTALYMSPELIVCNKEELEAHPFASDIYSYGILAWQVMTGEKPYQHQCAGLSGHQIKQKVVEGMRPHMPQIQTKLAPATTAPNPITELEVEIAHHKQQADRWPAGVVCLLESCWNPRADTRPSFVAVLSALQDVEGGFCNAK